MKAFAKTFKECVFYEFFISTLIRIVKELMRIYIYIYIYVYMALAETFTRMCFF